MKNVGIGIVGIGFMGMIHYLAAQKVKDAKVVALASRDPKKRTSMPCPNTAASWASAFPSGWPSSVRGRWPT